MTRYAEIESVEDLGLGYPPVDDTGNDAGANKYTPDAANLGGSGVEGVNTTTHEGDR